MEAACNAASRTAQLLTKDTPQEEISQMMTVMASIKEQLSKVSLMSANSQMLKFGNLNFFYKTFVLTTRMQAFAVSNFFRYRCG